MTSPKEVFKLIENEGIEFVGFRFTDFDGQTHQLTIPARDLSEEAFTKGTNFDGSSIPGWRFARREPDLRVSAPRRAGFSVFRR